MGEEVVRAVSAPRYSVFGSKQASFPPERRIKMAGFGGLNKSGAADNSIPEAFKDSVHLANTVHHIE